MTVLTPTNRAALNDIFIRTANKVMLPTPDIANRFGLDWTAGAPEDVFKTALQHERTRTRSYVASVVVNMASLGWSVSESLLQGLTMLSAAEVETFYTEVTPVLQKIVGAHVVYRPMYPNLPRQVMEASQAELYINAILHYWAGTRPANAVDHRMPLPNKDTTRVLDLGSEVEFNKMMGGFLTAKTSLSPTQKADVLTYLASVDMAAPDYRLPDAINFRETLALIGAEVVARATDPVNVLRDSINYPTDVLRIAVQMSGGDVSLADNTKFTKFPRPVRRKLLELIESTFTGLNYDDSLRLSAMLKHEGVWIRLGERLHPGEYEKKFPRTAAAFKALRTGIGVYAKNRVLELAFERKDLAVALSTLRNRPGELARRLDHLLRTAQTRQEHEAVVETFGEVAGRVSTPVLLQMRTALLNRAGQTHDERYVMPKGPKAKLTTLPDARPALRTYDVAAIQLHVANVLRNRFRELGGLGRIYIDERLKDYPVPFAMRSASKTIRTLVRGSKIAFGNDPILRFFLHWKNQDPKVKHMSQVDIDLSAVHFKEDWSFGGQISWTNLRSRGVADAFGRGGGIMAAHSGDITDAPNGAAEFIDIDVQSVLDAGSRYVAMNVFSYRGQPFAEVPQCFAGWMTRETPQLGEIFEPTTVREKIDLTAEATSAIPMILDCLERKVIWMDLGLKGGRGGRSESSYKLAASLGKAITQWPRPNLYDLFMYHSSRGVLVDRKEDADIIFSPDEGVTPFDMATIVREYLV